MLPRPAVHVAVPVDDLDSARQFYGNVLGLDQGRSSAQWIDWDFHGHQLVTHVVSRRSASPGSSEVDGRRVPIPHFGLLLSIEHFHRLADRLRAAGVAFVIEPYLRYADQPAQQWTMFLQDPAGNALEFKAFYDETQVFAR